MSFLWTQFAELTWWQMILWAVYTIYFFVRAYVIWDYTSEFGMKQGYRYSFFGRFNRTVRLYHIIRMILDIPPMIVGIFFPLLRAMFKLKIYEFKEEKKSNNKGA